MAVVIAHSAPVADGAAPDTSGFNIDAIQDLNVSPDALQLVTAAPTFLRLTARGTDDGTDGTGEPGGEGVLDIIVTGLFTAADTGGTGTPGPIEDVTSLDQIAGESQVFSIHIGEDGQDLVTLSTLNIPFSDLQTWLNGGTADTLLDAAFGGRDLMLGSDQDDTLRGFGGIDLMEGHGGNDSMDGGAGFDTLFLSDNRADWTFTPRTTDGDGTGDTFTGTEGEQVWLATNAVTGETDTITDFERVSFADAAFLIEELVGDGGTDEGGGTGGVIATSDIWAA